MGGASDVPPSDPMMDGGDPMGGGPDMGEPGMGGPMDGDPNAMGEPGMGGPNDGQLDPEMGALGSGPDMGGGPEEEGDDSTMSIINQLSPEDREAVRSYAESMLSRDEAKGGMEGGPDPMGEDPMGGGPGPDAGGPMMEARRRFKQINENLPVTDFYSRKEKNINDKKKGNNLSRKSPFNSPKFK